MENSSLWSMSNQNISNPNPTALQEICIDDKKKNIDKSKVCRMIQGWWMQGIFTIAASSSKHRKTLSKSLQSKLKGSLIKKKRVFFYAICLRIISKTHTKKLFICMSQFVYHFIVCLCCPKCNFSFLFFNDFWTLKK